MRSLSFRSLFLLLMGLPVLVTTGVLGGVAYRAASGFLIQDAMRAVGIAANAREQALVSRLHRQQERAQGFLRVVGSECAASSPGPERSQCIEDNLTAFVTTEEALGARLLLPGQPPFQVGHPSSVPGALASLPDGQVARFEPRVGPERAYELVAESGGMRVGLRYGLDQIAPLFAERYGLGGSGETFLR